MNTDSKIPSDLTTLDLIKAFALIIMIIDHIGFYLIAPMPDAVAGDPTLWWRAIGRIGLPIWFFLLGYANTRAIPPLMIGGAVVLLIANIVTGMFIVPFNALVTMVIIRLVLDHVARVTFGSLEGCVGVILLMALGFLISNWLTEYGTIALWLALMGYAARHARGQGAWLFKTRLGVPIFLGIGIMATITSQMLIFHFSAAQIALMITGLVGVFAVLLAMQPRTYPDLTHRLPRVVTAMIQVAGRRTLELYVLHLVLFKFLALTMGWGLPIYGWFDWDFDIYGAFARPNA
jgi:hypothetical protein